jgi:hypothetical protein
MLGQLERHPQDAKPQHFVIGMCRAIYSVDEGTRVWPSAVARAARRTAPPTISIQVPQSLECSSVPKNGSPSFLDHGGDTGSAVSASSPSARKNDAMVSSWFSSKRAQTRSILLIAAPTLLC